MLPPSRLAESWRNRLPRKSDITICWSCATPCSRKNGDSLNVIATQSRVPVYQLDPFVNAPDLIGQVSRLLT